MSDGKQIIDEDTFMNHVLNSMPSSYDNEVMNLQEAIDKVGDEKVG